MMESYEYQTLYDLEDSYWWFRGLRASLSSQIHRFKPAKVSKALDAGCGTGRNLLLLSETLDCECYGIDLSKDASQFWEKRNLKNVKLGSVNQIPFPDRTFDFVICIDVLECDEVKEEIALGEIGRVLTDSGRAIITVPACKWLCSKEHDAAVHAHKRFSEFEFRKLLESRGFRTLRTTHLFPIFFPLIALSRFIENLKTVPGIPKSNIKALPGIVNTLFSAIAHLESWFLKWTDFAWGSSLLAIVERKG